MFKLRKHPISSLLLLLMIAAASNAQQVASNQEELPNIVYILADDLGYGDVSAYDENSA